MSLTLTADITATARTLTVTGTVPAAVEPGYRFRLDDELLEFTTFALHDVAFPSWTEQHQNPQAWKVLRGRGGTVPASHSAGATIEAVLGALVAAADDDPLPDPFAAGGGGGLPTGWTQEPETGLVYTSGALSVGSFTSLGSVAATTRFEVGTAGTYIIGGSASPVGSAALLGSLYLRTNGQLWQKTGAGALDWTQLGGTPAAALRVVRFPIAFDDAGLHPVTYAITAVDVDPANTFTIAGNHAADFVTGQHLNVVGSTGNDATYTIVSAVFGAATVITVNEAVADATADGDITTLPGVVAFTPAVGDVVLTSLVTVSLTTGFDGSGPPTLYLFQSGAPDYTNSIASISGVEIDQPDTSESSDFSDLTHGKRFSISGALPINCLSTRPWRLGYSDTADGDPGSTVGEGEVVFVVQSA